MISARELGWIAGLVEGEGSFGIPQGSPTIQMGSTDPDVVGRAAQIFGVKLRGPYQPKRKTPGPAYTPVYYAVAQGSKAISWMFMMYPLLGERRRARIADVVEAWKAGPRRPKQIGRSGRSAATCHPERLMLGKGLCRPCYMRKWRSEHA